MPATLVLGERANLLSKLVLTIPRAVCPSSQPGPQPTCPLPCPTALAACRGGNCTQAKKLKGQPLHFLLLVDPKCPAPVLSLDRNHYRDSFTVRCWALAEAGKMGRKIIAPNSCSGRGELWNVRNIKSRETARTEQTVGDCRSTFQRL